jgi:hypothetical protein
MPSYHTPFILVSVSDTILGSESSSLRVVISLLGHTSHSWRTRDKLNTQRIHHYFTGDEDSTYISSQLSQPSPTEEHHLGSA